MSLPKTLAHCPISPECTAKKLYQDDDGKVYRISGSSFVPHLCTVKNSEKPELAYLGEWFNHDTGRTRWIGPVRMRRTAEIAPTDGRFKRRGAAKTGWELMGVHITDLKWTKVDK